MFIGKHKNKFCVPPVETVPGLDPKTPSGISDARTSKPVKTKNVILVLTMNIQIYELRPELKRKRVKPDFAFTPSATRNVRETEMAVSIETRTPSPKTSAKPLMSDVRNQKRMTAVIIEEMLESRMEGQARANPSRMASAVLEPLRSSSFMRSKMSTLASTAMPTERMNAAMPAAVSVTGISLKSARTVTM